MPLARCTAHRLACRLLMSACFVAAAVAQIDCRAVPVTVEFPDFPLGAVMVDLGQSLTINAETHNDGGKGVTWSCTGNACTTLTTTPQWAAFHASGITGDGDRHRDIHSATECPRNGEGHGEPEPDTGHEVRTHRPARRVQRLSLSVHLS